MTRVVRLLTVLVAAAVAALSVASSLRASGVQATSLELKSPTAAVPTTDGGFLVTDEQTCIVTKVSSTGAASQVAGTGCGPDTGDGGSATQAQLDYPTDAVPTSDGGFLIADGGPIAPLVNLPVFGGAYVRKVSSTGMISTVAGNGVLADTGDGGPATSAAIDAVSVVPYDAPGAAVPTSGSGFLFADPQDCVIRKVSATGMISTVAGNGVCGLPTVELGAESCAGTSFCMAAGANLGEFGGGANAVVTGDPSQGAQATWTTQGNIDSTPYPLGATPPTIGAVSCPSTSLCVALDSAGNVLTTTDPTDGESAKWALNTSTAANSSQDIPTSISCPSTALCVATGTGDIWAATDPSSGSGATWTDESGVDTPTNGIANILMSISCPSTNLCVAVDDQGNVVTSTDPSSGASATWTVTNIPSAVAPLNAISCHSQTMPSAETVCAAGDSGGNMITSTNPGANSASAWHVTSADSGATIGSASCPSVTLCLAADNSSVNGNLVSSTDPGAGTPKWTVQSGNSIGSVNSVACPSASLCVAGGDQEVFTATDPTDGAQTAWAGDLLTNGDGRPATSASLSIPASATPTADGGFLIAEFGNPATGVGCDVREVSAAGTISTVAGNGFCGFGGDGGEATASSLDEPTTAVPTPGGGFLIADYGNHRIRSVSQSGTITTVAGDGGSSPSGDGGQATSAALSAPTAAVPLSGGGFLIGAFSASSNSQAAVREVSPSGTITTVAGTSFRSLRVSKTGTGSGKVRSAPSGIICPATCTASFAVGSMVTLTAVPSSGSAFTGWSGGGCRKTGKCTVAMKSNETVTASFKKAAPNTQITKAIINAKKREASFSFKAIGTASGFQCALVKKPKPPQHAPKPTFSACRPPKTYTHLSLASYTFLVRALNAAGADPTPATKTFTIT